MRVRKPNVHMYNMLTELFVVLGAWILKQSVGQIGWRNRKHYFKVNHKQSQKQNQTAKLESQPSTSSSTYKENLDQEYLLSWTEFGPDKQINDKEMNAILKSLAKIKHPFILPIELDI